MSLTGLVSPVVSLLSAELIRRGLVTKKSVAVTGLFTLAATGLISLEMHTRLWHLGLLSVLTGMASGCYLSTIMSIMVDIFNPMERQTGTGVQAVFVNVGSFLFSLLGGVLAAWQWHGGYVIFLIGLPVGILSCLTLPKEKRTRFGEKDAGALKSRFDTDVFFYAAAIIVFMLF